MKVFIYIVIGIVAASIVGGFFIVGSPKEARLRKFDEERVNNLSFIQSEIINYWIRKGLLPEILDDLTNNNLSGVIIPRDPQTGKIYSYGKIRDEKGLTFSLCADFSTGSNLHSFETHPQLPRDLHAPNWQHGVGYICFERTIDPELYRTPEFYRPPAPKR